MVKARAYFQLLKFRLSLTVAFSSAIGYMLGAHDFSWLGALLVMAGGLLVTGSANIINQIHERELDKLMTRTAKRPLPLGIITPGQAWAFCIPLGVAGLGLLAFYFNPLTAALSLLSLILYGFIYTPLKTISPICVARLEGFVAAIPSAGAWGVEGGSGSRRLQSGRVGHSGQRNVGFSGSKVRTNTGTAKGRPGSASRAWRCRWTAWHANAPDS